MKSATRRRLAREFGQKILQGRARKGHSVQKLHDLLAAKGFEKPPTPRTIQRHEAGEIYPSPRVRAMYAAVYQEVIEGLQKITGG